MGVDEGLLTAMLLGSLGTLLCLATAYRFRAALARRALDWRGALDPAETRFQAQIDGAFADDGDDDGTELTAEDLAQLQTLERELEGKARGGAGAAAAAGAAGGAGGAAAAAAAGAAAARAPTSTGGGAAAAPAPPAPAAAAGEGDEGGGGGGAGGRAS